MDKPRIDELLPYAGGSRYALVMIAAKRAPGQRCSRSFPKAIACELVERARHCGFVVDAGSHRTAPDELVTIAVTWPGNDASEKGDA